MDSIIIHIANLEPSYFKTLDISGTSSKTLSDHSAVTVRYDETARRSDTEESTVGKT